MFLAPAREILHDRALMLQYARAFFAKRSLLEVDCCALNPHAAIDANIDAIHALAFDQGSGFLHTSPEYAMKKLLSYGLGDIYYLGHVFRKGDLGPLHNPEFTMAEWYRCGMKLDDLILEVCEFLSLFFGQLPLRKVAYREAFTQYVNLDFSAASIEELQKHAAAHGASLPHNWTRDVLVHFLLSHVIEPQLGQGELTILMNYPPREAALACVIEENGEKVAERFEVYYKGVELANGYHELSDAQELRRRFQEENETRRHQNREMYSLDESFLAAMHQSFPDCCGVSVGFDRALMLRNRAKSIEEVLPFAWPKRNYTIYSE